MHPRIEARVAGLSEARGEAILDQLDFVIGQLTRLRQWSGVEQLIVRYRAIRALVAEGKLLASRFDDARAGADGRVRAHQNEDSLAVACRAG